MRFSILISCLLSIFVLAACGGKKCKVGTSQCVSKSVIRTCIPGGDNSWFTHECGGDEVCEEGALTSTTSTGDAGASTTKTKSTSTKSKADAGATTGNAACVGACEQGHSECVSAQLSRYCVDGRVWQLDACEVGERCVDGVCTIGVDGAVQACKPGARACASDMVEKQCDPDGTAWVDHACDPGETCLIDRCAPDPMASCDEPSSCMDNKTALRCRGTDQGFELVTCPGTTYCEGGRCRGPVCALGSLCLSANQIRECVDGTSLRDSSCKVTEICQQQGDKASCTPKSCVPDTTVCGDPSDPTVDTKKNYTHCLAGSATSSGVPELVRGECVAPATCDPASAAAGTPCRLTCTTGEQTCMVDAQSGIADGFAECQSDGTWGDVQRCNTGADGRLQCVIKPSLDASALPKALCAEPVCAYAIANMQMDSGTCDAGQLMACDADGKLGQAAACKAGICRSISSVRQADGRLPGACDANTKCTDGEERCVEDGASLTPLYQTCSGGAWSPAIQTCPDDGTCVDYLDHDGHSHKVCGANCVPGRRQCDANGKLQTCSDSGSWGTAQSCSSGSCQAIGNNDAACVLECVPGSVRCTGASMLASDQMSQGFAEEAKCGSDGTLGTPTACTTGEVCRVSGTGEHIGCVACVGAKVAGGNAQGIIDTRCDPMDTTKVQECADDNTWAASRACTSPKTCVGPRGPTCGMCLSAAGNDVVCTQTNINDLKICGSCSTGSSGTASPCTQTQINALTSGAQSCTSLFTGSTTAWGGQPDCCNGNSGAFLQTSNATCSSRGYGIPGAWGGEPDCCSTRWMSGSGSGVAYCGP